MNGDSLAAVVPEVGITTDDGLDVSLDQRKLFAEGLDSIRALAGRTWTDHNVHDPGITMLELVAYALTDLSYRARFPIEDLVAAATDNAANMARQFPSARTILPNRVLTALDYRKLIIDLPGVKNAWVHPVPLVYWVDLVREELSATKPASPGSRPAEIRGLYRVLLEYEERVTATKTEAEVDQAVTALLHANRNLCEDFVAIEAVDRQPFILCGEIQLTPAADTAQVMAEILTRVQNYLAPSPANYSLDEMLARGYSVQEIFEGPTLACGFFDDAELAAAELRTEVRLSDVMRIVMGIDGVEAIRELIVNPTGASSLANKWVVPVGPGKEAFLDDARSRLVFYKGAMPVVPRAEVVAERRAALAERARAKLETPVAYDIPVPLGRYRALHRYYSFQNHFPAVYGVGETGARGGGRRAMQALQLKGYLLLFDQVMANFCAQLEGIKELFTTAPVDHTYFTQLVTTFTEHARLYPAATPGDKVAAVTETRPVRNDRRGRILDHLIARFGERFHDQMAVMQSAFGLGPESLEDAKGAFVDDYPESSSSRGMAEDYSLTDPSDQWDTGNVSGLQRRVCRLLGIGNVTRRDLSQVPVDGGVQIEESPAGQFSFRLTNEAGDLVLSSNVKEASADAALAAFATAAEHAQLPSGIQRRVASDGTFFFNVVDRKETVLARRRQFFATDDEMEAAILALMSLLRRRYSREGMFVIEHITLRPEPPGPPFLPICVDPDCTDCGDDDPYSYRISVVLPAFAGRFRDMDFRRYAEQLIREETPAHILARICWVSDEDIDRVGRAFRAWIEVRANRTAADTAARLEELGRVLSDVKSVYPQEHLRDCDSPEDQSKFLLGRTALGSGEEIDV